MDSFIQIRWSKMASGSDVAENIYRKISNRSQCGTRRGMMGVSECMYVFDRHPRYQGLFEKK